MRARSMKVIDLAVHHVETITAQVSIRECAKAMRSHHVGSLVVVNEKNEPTGMITDRDVAIEVVATGRDADATSVGEVMSSPAVVTKGEENIIDALARMREFGIRRLPVVDGEGKLVGVVTNSNMLEELSMMLDSIVRDIKSSKTREIAERP
ncbi:CBS domain-containing protein [Mesosutterella sp. OilRF-GAM-744-9]|uniref:CBS domain-containing protein n=1 Tax=Mesosutterella porci TaxID=2915351 RepID=A0ABS9MNJ9_9BURK|nr:CBS domain-containing protein [Mesosutterella sp. oilRF-744-WT-GAM-9]MCG5030190.1 CBS domain-containing protein [Mesosutterella sp. oilRF-744-WT-GAM-9]MCI6531241.1 CBS domain-containing protein [Mesosutterella sp.]